ncbi:serine protease [Acidobacteriota bacterium]
MKESVAFLFIKENSEYYPVGTGFWFTGCQGNKGKKTYLVTAKHILQEHKKIHIRINSTKKESIFLDFDQKRTKVLIHRNPGVDIAFLPLSPPKDSECLILNEGMIIDQNFEDKIGMIEGDNVYFVGMIPQVYGAQKNTPVVRSGKIALVTDEPFEDEEGTSNYYYIDANCCDGNSGSPVFLKLATMNQYGMIEPSNTNVMLMGVLHGYLNEEREIQGKTKSRNLYFNDNIHIALVTKAKYLIDILTQEKKRYLK